MYYITIILFGKGGSRALRATSRRAKEGRGSESEAGANRTEMFASTHKGVYERLASGEIEL